MFIPFHPKNKKYGKIATLNQQSLSFYKKSINQS